jgi:hypothetical protein
MNGHDHSVVRVDTTRHRRFAKPDGVFNAPYRRAGSERLDSPKALRVLILRSVFAVAAPLHKESRTGSSTEGGDLGSS